MKLPFDICLSFHLFEILDWESQNAIWTHGREELTIKLVVHHPMSKYA